MTKDYRLFVPATVLAFLANGQDFVAFADVDDAVRAEAEADPSIVRIRERQQALADRNQEILNTADGENRNLRSEESEAIAAGSAEWQALENEAAQRIGVIIQNRAANRPQPRRSAPTPLDRGGDPPEPRRGLPADYAPRDRGGDFDPRASGSPYMAGYGWGAQNVAFRRATPNGDWGFRGGMGQFAQAVAVGSRQGGVVDERLTRHIPRNAAATTMMQESIATDGGFLVAPDFRTEILSQVFNPDQLIQRTDQWESSSNAIVLPVDNKQPWQPGGITAYWEGEGTTLTQSKFNLEQQSFRLHKLAALIPVTDELLEDAPSLEAMLIKKAREQFQWKLSWGIMRGNGVGMPLGIMNAPGRVIVDKESGQAADTINAQNIVNMFSRMPPGSLPNAVWLINPDLIPKLMFLVHEGNMLYLPPGGMSNAPYGTLLGRPVVPHQVMSTAGDLGDIAFVDFRQYLTVAKNVGLRQDVSIHLWFDQMITAFRFTMRIAGHPWWAKAMEPFQGNLTLSPYVFLAERA